MSEILETLAMLSMLIFVICSMLNMGLSLTIGQIVGPLKNTRLVTLALLANFVLVPALAYAPTALMPLNDAAVITYLMVVAIIGFVVLFPAAGELGKRQARRAEGETPAAA